MSRDGFRRPAPPRERPLIPEAFAPIELDPKVAQHLRRVEYEGNSPLAGRLHQITDWERWSMQQRIAFLRSFVEDTSRDPAIVEKANEIIRSAGVQLRDHRAEWAALLKWVQQNIRFMAESKERIQSPQYTLTQKMGDCFPAGTKLLRKDGKLVPVDGVKVGDFIWGYDRWSRVEAVANKGVLPVTRVGVRDRPSIFLTEDHLVYARCSGETYQRSRVQKLKPGMELLVPASVPGGRTSEIPAVVEGLYPGYHAGKVCYDIQTDDHYVYLPEADVTVSNCDDLALTLAALGYSMRLPFKFVLSGRDKRGRRIRWVEGAGKPPEASWTHIYVQAQWPPFRPTAYAWAEPTLDVPLGWDSVSGGRVNGRADLGESEALPATTKQTLQQLVQRLPWVTIGGSVLGSVLSAVVVGLVVKPRLEGRRLRKSRRLS